MDRIHKPEEQAFISNVVSVRDFYIEALSSANELFLTNDDGSTRNNIDDHENSQQSQMEKIAEQMCCEPDMCQELQQLCNPERLKDGKEPDEDDALESAIPETNLLTLQLLKEENQKKSSNPTYRQQVVMKCKYYRTNFRLLECVQSSSTSNRNLPEDVILLVNMLKPYNRQLEYHQIRLGRLLKQDSSFLVCGRMKLSKLKDKISCPSDFAFDRDFSDDPNEVIDSKQFSRENFPSGFFFIHNTFYNDNRRDGSQDLSAVIRDWATRRRGEVGPFQTAVMDDTTFMDLKLRLGQPYVYVHQGSCEHLFFVSDIRLMTSEDKQDVDSYPIQILHKIRKRVPCCGCKIYTAKWVVHENNRLPMDPAFFCEECFKLFNYDKLGNKIGDFKAVPYFDRSALS